MRFTFCVSSQTLSGSSCTGRSWPCSWMAALGTTTSRRPRVSRVRSKAASTCAGSETSQVRAMARPLPPLRLAGPTPLDLLRHGGEGALGAPQDGHGGPFGRQAPGGGGAHPAPAPGDEGHLPAEPAWHGLAYPLCGSAPRPYPWNLCSCRTSVRMAGPGGPGRGTGGEQSVNLTGGGARDRARGGAGREGYTGGRAGPATKPARRAGETAGSSAWWAGARRRPGACRTRWRARPSCRRPGW